MRHTYSLDAESIKQVEKAVSELYRNKEEFCKNCKISRSTYYKIIKGKNVDFDIRNLVEKHLKEKGKLKDEEPLVWISKLEQQPKNQHDNAQYNSDNDLSTRITKIQKALEIRIYEKCGRMRVLTMKEPIETLKVYVNLDICSNNNKHRLYLDNILANELIRLRENNQPDSLRLIVVGSAGAGKTMLLRRLALSCFQETSVLNKKRHLPIYIRLRDYTEEQEEIPGLENYIVHEYNIDSSDIVLLSQTGQLLILFDGFDTIGSNNKEKVYYQINRFINKFPNNDYIISCKNEERIFETFEQVELSVLDDKKICTLVENRIRVNSPYLSDDQKNKLLAEIQNDKDLRVIAQNPLLLVLICLIYADRGFDALVKEKWKVIYEATSVLLEGWDREQGIAYETETNFSKKDKAKFLSFVAYRLIQNGKDCLNEQTLEEYISEYIQNIHSTYPNQNPQRLYTAQDIFTSLESEHTLLIRRSDWKYEFPRIIFKDLFAMIFIRSEFKSLDSFKSQDILRVYPNRWERFLKVADSAYPVIFGEANS